MDHLVRVVAIAGLSIPGFWLATMVLVLPAFWWGWAPPFGYKSLAQDPLAHVQQMFIPAAVMSVSLAASLMRMTRSMMLDVMRQDFIRTASAKGLSKRVVIFRHCLQNALLPLGAIVGLNVALLLAGTVIFESVFALPGVGSFLFDGVTRRDYPIVQGVTVTLTFGVVLINLLVDLSYRVLDPRLAS